MLHTSKRGARVPAALRPPSAADVDVEWLTLQWTPPKDDGGSAVTSFDVEAVPLDGDHPLDSEGDHPLRCHAAPPELNCTTRGLRADTTYACRARAVNSVGPSAWSNATRVRTGKAAAPRRPGVPLPSAGEPLLLRWAPADARGSPVSQYELELDDWWEGRPAGSSYRRLYNGSAPQYEADEGVDHLLPASHYAVRVHARNRLGVGEWSEAGTLTTSARGACGNGHDVPAYDTKRGSFKHDVQTALVACLIASDKRACVRAKLANAPGLTRGCADCWFAEGMCTLSACAVQCLNPESASCKACSERKCFPACVQCTGMPLWAFPP